MDLDLKFIRDTEYCFLPKLTKGFDECDSHKEYDIWKYILDQQFPTVLSSLRHIDPKKESICCSLLSYVIILYEELQSEGPWHFDKCKIYSIKLNNEFGKVFGVTLDNVLIEKTVFNVQTVFDNCMKYLHVKLTLEEIKHYPCFTEVYCRLIQNIMKYNITINPLRVMPVAIILIDDHIDTNKIKGLTCCKHILQHLIPKDFDNGNYYEVIYKSLRKNLSEKDLDVNILMIECMWELLRLLPINIKNGKLNDLFSDILDQLLVELNINRKVLHFIFINNAIESLRLNCIKKKKLLFLIVCDNLDIMCSNEAIREMLLPSVFQCIQVWTKYCWCVWKFSSDIKLLTALFKLLYTENKKDIVTNIQQLIGTLICLCTVEDKKKILVSLEKMQSIEKDLKNKVDIIIQMTMQSLC